MGWAEELRGLRRGGKRIPSSGWTRSRCSLHPSIHPREPSPPLRGHASDSALSWGGEGVGERHSQRRNSQKRPVGTFPAGIMKKFASTRSLNKILQQCDSSSREYEEIQAVEKKWHLHLATPRKFREKRCKMPSLFLAAPPPPKRAPSTTLTLRSKSMTAELEELGKAGGGMGSLGNPG